MGAATVALALSLLAASAVAWIRPSTSMLPTYLGLAFPILALLNTMAGLYWVAKRKWYLVLPVGTLLLCGHNLQKTLALHGGDKTEDTTAGKKRLKILTYNVKLFNFYDKKTPILEYILQQDADIVCLQEFGYHTGKETRFLKRADIMEKMRKAYPYHHFGQADIRLNGTYGVATFSKHPLVSHKEINFDSSFNSAIYSDLRVGRDTIRVVNAHLESNKLTTSDKKGLQRWQDFNLTDSTSKKTAKELDKKLSEAYQLREKQAEMVAEVINSTHYPTVLCGDLNDVPVSYTYSTLAGSRLTDAFTEKGQGYGHTFNEGMIKFRIDYVMHSNHYLTHSYLRDKVDYSDHYPLVVELAKKDN